jgi:tetraacyldisaccharide 4'-kinase
VRLDEPSWWYASGPDGRARWLAPVGRLYGRIVEKRYRGTEPYRARLLVICIGNFTLGGTGKTPLAILVARLLRDKGETPAFLTRGYGGCNAGPFWIDPERTTAADGGDEPLLLARVAPTMVARDRREGARAIEVSDRGVSVIVMDDGLQNPALAKDLTIAVVDGTRGFGNGHVFPAGPLRAPLPFQLTLADAIVCNRGAVAIGEDKTAVPADGIQSQLRRSFPGPVLESGIRARAAEWLSGQSVIAFAGIGNPARFFDMVQQLGGMIAEQAVYPDHHPFSEREAADLLQRAQARGALLVTTEKDHARLAGARNGALGTLAAEARVLGIEAVFPERDLNRLSSLLDAARAHSNAGRRK